MSLHFIRRFCIRIPSACIFSRACSQAGESSSQSRLRIYTRTGDKGITSDFAGQRLPKDGAAFEALGTTDELNSALGVAGHFCKEENHDVAQSLYEIQCILQEVGSHIATPRTVATEKKLALTTFSEAHVRNLEKEINKMDDQLPQLTNFIIPSGGKSSCFLHQARSICRRAERRVLPLYREGQVSSDVVKFINRLSDYLFTAARYVAMKEGREELTYKRVKDIEK